MVREGTRLFIRTATNGEYVGDLSEYVPGKWMSLSNVVRGGPRRGGCGMCFVYPLIRFSMENIADISAVSGEGVRRGGTAGYLDVSGMRSPRAEELVKRLQGGS